MEVIRVKDQVKFQITPIELKLGESDPGRARRFWIPCWERGHRRLGQISNCSDCTKKWHCMWGDSEYRVTKVIQRKGQVKFKIAAIELKLWESDPGHGAIMNPLSWQRSAEVKGKVKVSFCSDWAQMCGKWSRTRQKGRLWIQCYDGGHLKSKVRSNALDKMHKSIWLLSTWEIVSSFHQYLQSM